MTTRWLVLLALLAAATPGQSAEQSYDYPFVDPFGATVVGTPSIYKADLPQSVPLEERQLLVFEGRQVPDLFWYADRLRFGLLAQDHAAPLAFVIAGTGGGYASSKSLILIRMFHQIGFHVIALPSPLHQNFIVAASTTSVPGLITEDAEDLYRVMRLAYQQVKGRIEVRGFDLVGYSLGGAQAAFIAKLDEQEQAFGFQRVLMINPPVSLVESARILDRMLEENTPEGIGVFTNQLMTALIGVVAPQDTVNFADDFLYTVYRRREPKDESLAGAIGLVFRVLLANMIFTTDVMTKAGYIAPKSPPLRSTDSLTTYAEVALRTGFQDYIDDLFVPFFKARQPGVTREDLFYRSSLKSIESYLASSTKIGLMTNEDDVTLADGDIDYLRQVFGNRAQIYIKGGHGGNLEYPDNVADMIAFFKR